MSETPLPEVQAQRDDSLMPREVRVCAEDVGYVLDIDVAPDGTVVLGTTSQEIIFARLDSPKLESIPRAGAVVAVSPDGRFIATAFENGARLRDFSTGALIHRYEGDNPAFGLHFDRTSKRFVSAEVHRGTVAVHDTSTATRHHCQGAFGTWVDAAWLDDTTFVTCGRVGAVAIWNADTHLAVAQKTGQVGNLTSVSVSPGARAVVTAGMESVALWEGPEMRPVVQIRGLAPVHSVAVTKDGRFVWCAGEQTLAFLELATGRYGLIELYASPGLIKLNYHVAVVNDGQQAVSAGPDLKLRLWNPPERAITTGGTP